MKSPNEIVDAVFTALFRWTYEKFCRVMYPDCDPETSQPYLQEKWRTFTDYPTTWWSELDDSHRERFYAAIR